jgi:predicted ATPase/DNA-binding CsgD family transcriptional regulator
VRGPPAGRERPNNLPALPTSFVGRERAVAEVARLLGRTRLLTLTGTGGVGKTRLALRVAGDRLAAFGDGAWLADLAPLTDPGLVLQTVASALGVREQPGRPLLETLLDALRTRHLLLVLDNCEHLLDACAALCAAVLPAAPRVSILATSRQSLRVDGEVTWRVPSLATPPLDAAPTTGGTAMEYEAARLFAERAAAARPDFAVGEQGTAAVAQICRRLDGIPLAIELAAALAPVLSVEQIAARLDERVPGALPDGPAVGRPGEGDPFRLLAAGRRSAPPRHRTLRATLDWSHDLLTEAERALFRRLAVFAGGWTLEAAEAVCASGTEPPASEDVLELLAGLVDKSVVIAEPRGQAVRFHLLETLRAYASEKLAEAGEVEALRARHQRWFVDLVERLYPHEWGPRLPAVWRELEAEQDNLRAAMERGQAPGGDAAGALALAGALHRFWLVVGHISEGRAWTERLLPLAPAPRPARALGLLGAGFLALFQDDLVEARTLLEECLTLSRAVGYDYGAAIALLMLGAVAVQQGELDRAEALFEACRPAWPADRTDGSKVGRGMWLFWQGHLARARGVHERVTALFEQALVSAREGDDAWALCLTLDHLGDALLVDGEYERAAGLLRESLARRLELSDRLGLAMSLDALAQVASAQRESERAARLFGAAEALREGTGFRPLRGWSTAHERWLDEARSALGARRFEAGWASGRAMRLDEAVAYALGKTAPPAPAPAAAGPAALTPREREVAGLVAQGLTTREIAERLVIAPGTAALHVEHIRAKLGFHTRAQIAAWYQARAR